MVNYCFCLWSSEDVKLLFVSLQSSTDTNSNLQSSELHRHNCGALKIVNYCLCLWGSEDGKLLFVSVEL
jgi:hypothetical protein